MLCPLQKPYYLLMVHLQKRYWTGNDLNTDLSELNEWFKENRYSLNITKTRFIHFNTTQTVLPKEHPFKIGTSEIQQKVQWNLLITTTQGTVIW